MKVATKLNKTEKSTEKHLNDKPFSTGSTLLTVSLLFFKSLFPILLSPRHFFGLFMKKQSSYFINFSGIQFKQYDRAEQISKLTQLRKSIASIWVHSTGRRRRSPKGKRVGCQVVSFEPINAKQASLRIRTIVYSSPWTTEEDRTSDVEDRNRNVHLWIWLTVVQDAEAG